MDLKKMTQIARHMVDLRDKKAQLTAVFNAEVAKIDELYDKLVQMALAENGTDSGVHNIATEAGTLMFDEKTRANVVDWPAFYAFIVKNGRFDFLHRRVTDAAVSEYVRDNPDNPDETPPDGVSLFTVRTVTVRRAGGKA